MKITQFKSERVKRNVLPKHIMTLKKLSRIENSVIRSHFGRKIAILPNLEKISTQLNHKIVIE